MWKHRWERSKLGHGNLMCVKCCITDMEAHVLGCIDVCEVPDKENNNDNNKKT